MLSKKFTAVAGAAAEVADDYFKNVSLLLSGDGTNGAQNNGTANPFLDSSTNNFTITRNGNTTQGSYSPYGSLWSNYCASNGYLTTAGNAVFNLTGDFTIEAWVYLTTYTGNAYNELMVWECRSGGGTGSNFYIANAASGKGGAIGFWINGSAIESATAGTVPLNAWTHIAVSRSGSGSNNIKIFVNGTQVVQGTNTATVGDSTTTNYVGSSSYAQSFNNYISNFRLTKDGALYTGSFTPSTTPLNTTVSSGTVSLLTCQSNRFVDNSGNALPLTATNSPSVQRFSPFNPTAAYSTATIGGSGYFDGSDYLQISHNSALSITGNVDACLVSWVYPTGSGAGIIINKSGIGGVSYANYQLSLNSSRNAVFFGGNSGSPGSAQVTLTGSSVLPVNAWSYIVATKKYVGGGPVNEYRIFVNGKLDGYTTQGNISDSRADVFTVGQEPSGTALTGIVSDVQVFNSLIPTDYQTASTTTGTQVFTPPTTPVAPITGTQLLLNFTNAGIYDNAMMNDLETVGNAQISTSVKKYGTGSLAFDGTGDYLVIPSSPNFALGTGDFTFECWCYPTSSASFRYLFSIGGDSNFTFALNSGTYTPYFYAGSTILTSSQSLTGSQWNHVALVRNSGTLAIYVNGVSGGTASFSTSISAGIGYVAAQSTGSYPLTGYIDDLRITKGLARYTSNFTAPTEALPAY